MQNAYVYHNIRLMALRLHGEQILRYKFLRKFRTFLFVFKKSLGQLLCGNGKVVKKFDLLHVF